MDKIIPVCSITEQTADSLKDLDSRPSGHYYSVTVGDTNPNISDVLTILEVTDENDTDGNGTDTALADGFVNLEDITTLSGTSSQFTKLYTFTESSHVIGLGNENITLSDAHDLAQLKVISNATTGTISLNDYTVALSGSTEDVKAALAELLQILTRVM